MKKTVQLVIVLISCVLMPAIFSQPALSQLPSNQQQSFGLFLSLNNNKHTMDDQSYYFSPYSYGGDGSGTGLSGGFFIQFNLSGSLDMNVKIGYFNISGKLNNYEKTSIVYQGSTVNAEIDHISNLDLSMIALEPLIIFNFFDRFNAIFGISIGFISNKDVRSYEELVYPADITFENGSRIRNDYSGKLTNTNSSFTFLTFGLVYDINITQSFIISPEIIYTKGLSPIIKYNDYKVDLIRFGISVKFPGNYF